MTFWIQTLAITAVSIAVIALVSFVIRVLWKLSSGEAARQETERRISEESASVER